MSREVLELVQGMDLGDITNQLALQCAPFIAGLKISNLLSVKCGSLHKVQKVLESLGISYYVMLRTDKIVTILLYDRNRLEAYLRDPRVRNLLRETGYTEVTLGIVLRRFRERYQQYMEDHQSFPHEMGILLGYPVEDVEGFIRNNGQNFLYAGYWKVYDFVPAKIGLFKKFDLARETIIQLAANGVSMADIMDIYSDHRLQRAAV